MTERVEYRLPYQPNDPEYIAWETCDGEHSMENLCVTCRSRAERIRKAIAAALAQAEREREEAEERVLESALVSGCIKAVADLTRAGYGSNYEDVVSGVRAEVERLKAAEQEWIRYYGLGTSPWQKRAEQAERERDHARETARIYMDGGVFKQLEQERDAARAEVERLKEEWKDSDEQREHAYGQRVDDMNKALNDLARLRAALRHEVNRNHEHTEACSACQESDTALGGRG